MPISYRIDEGRRTLFIRATGVARDEDLDLLWRTIIREPEMRPDLNELSDFTGVTACELSTRFVWELTESLKRFDAQRRQRAKIATVVTKDVLYGLAQMCAAICQDSPAEFRTFRSLSEAREWLGFSSEDSDSDSVWKEVGS